MTIKILGFERKTHPLTPSAREGEEVESKQTAQIPIASQRENPKRSEIIIKPKNLKVCKFIGKFERRRGILKLGGREKFLFAMKDLKH